MFTEFQHYLVLWHHQTCDRSYFGQVESVLVFVGYIRHVIELLGIDLWVICLPEPHMTSLLYLTNIFGLGSCGAFLEVIVLISHMICQANVLNHLSVCLSVKFCLFLTSSLTFKKRIKAICRKPSHNMVISRKIKYFT